MSVNEQLPPRTVAAENRHARMLIDGAWVDSVSGEILSVENPAKRVRIAAFPASGDQFDGR
jgi:hypothetical protein